VTAIGLTCAIYVACLVACGLLTLPIRGVTAHGYGDAKRALLAVHRAANAGLTRSLRALLGVVFGLVVAWALAGLIICPTGAVRALAAQVGYSVLSGLSGAACAVLLSFVSLRWAHLASFRAVVAAHITSDRLFTTVLRSSLLLTLSIEVFGLLVCLAVFGFCWMSLSGPALNSFSRVLPSAIQSLTSFTVGALLTSYSFQASGTTYRAAASTGTLTAEQGAHFLDVDPRNPSAIADKAGATLGQLVPQVLDTFCSALCANLLVCIILWQLLGSTPLADGGYLLIPVVMRAFGALAAVFGLGAARTQESVNPAAALVRSRAVVGVIALGAIWGTCYWLVPEIGVRVALCATLGFAFPIAIGHFQTWAVNRQVQPIRNERRSLENPGTMGLFLGMVMLLVPLLVLASVFLIAFAVGGALPLANGRVLAVAVCLLAMNIAVPLTISLLAASPLVFIARRTAYLLQRRHDESGRRRLTRLDDAIHSSSAWARSVQTAYSVAIPLVASAILGILSKGSRSQSLGAEHIVAVVAMTIGLLLPTAIRLRTSARATQSVVGEVRRQLSGVRREPTDSTIPPDFTPSYRNCVDIAARESTRSLSISAAATCIPGLLLGLGLVKLTKNPGLVGQALAMYLGQAAIAAFVVGFVLEVAIDFTSASRARSSHSSTLSDFATGNYAIHYLAASSTPAMRLLAKTCVIAALTFVPYLF